ncbi:sporulation protein YtfJ [Clostridium sp. CAG:1013]|jgi:sporulation protein YtfJ|nr:sporulation protein YtfJ [Clostridium sp. CAG:1013]
MSDNQVNNLLGVTMDKIKQMVDVNTVIGSPVTTPDGTTVIPVSRVSYGFASGGSDLPSKTQPSSGLFAGGSGAGITISPIAFLTIHEGHVRVLQIEPYLSSVDRALEKVPDVVDKITSLFQKEETPAKEETLENAPVKPTEDTL